jgi:hypothetical protein
VSNHDREKAILAAAQADSDANGDGTVNSVDFDNAERMIRAYEAALAAPVVQDVDERQGFVVVPVPAHVIREGDEVVTASGLGSVRKTVFSIIDGDEEGICLNFTDADALCLPVRDVLVLRVAERQRVSQDAPTAAPHSQLGRHDDLDFSWGKAAQTGKPLAAASPTPEKIERAAKAMQSLVCYRNGDGGPVSDRWAIEDATRVLEAAAAREDRQ